MLYVSQGLGNPEQHPMFFVVLGVIGLFVMVFSYKVLLSSDYISGLIPQFMREYKTGVLIEKQEIKRNSITGVGCMEVTFLIRGEQHTYLFKAYDYSKLVEGHQYTFSYYRNRILEINVVDSNEEN